MKHLPLFALALVVGCGGKGAQNQKDLLFALLAGSQGRGGPSVSPPESGASATTAPPQPSIVVPVPAPPAQATGTSAAAPAASGPPAQQGDGDPALICSGPHPGPISPTFVASTPAANETDVKTDATVAVYFNRPIDCKTVFRTDGTQWTDGALGTKVWNFNSIGLFEEMGQLVGNAKPIGYHGIPHSRHGWRVPATVDCVCNRLRIKPIRPLIPLSNYWVILGDDLKDQWGNRFAGWTKRPEESSFPLWWAVERFLMDAEAKNAYLHFSTGEVCDSVEHINDPKNNRPLSVCSISPRGGTVAAADAEVSVVFNKPVDCSWVGRIRVSEQSYGTPDAVFLVSHDNPADPTRPKLVSQGYSCSGRTIKIRPPSPLPAGAHVLAGAYSIYGIDHMQITGGLMQVPYIGPFSAPSRFLDIEVDRTWFSVVGNQIPGYGMDRGTRHWSWQVADSGSATPPKDPETEEGADPGASQDEDLPACGSVLPTAPPSASAHSTAQEIEPPQPIAKKCDANTNPDLPGGDSAPDGDGGPPVACPNRSLTLDTTQGKWFDSSVSGATRAGRSGVAAAIHTYWANQNLFLRVKDNCQAGWYRLVVTAKNTEGPLPTWYKKFNITVRAATGVLGGLNINASDSKFSRGSMLVHLPKGNAELNLVWTNDAFESGQYDANISLGDVSLHYVRSHTSSPSLSRSAAQYCDLTGRWFWERNTAFTFWQDQGLAFCFKDLAPGRYRVDLRARNYGSLPLPADYKSFLFETVVDKTKGSISIPAGTKYRRGSTIFEHFGGDAKVNLTWTNDRQVEGLSDANVQIRGLKLVRVGDSSSTLTGSLAGARKHLRGRNGPLAAMGLMALLALLAFYVRRRRAG